ncbi:hypothetical protein MKX07_005339 [Trichoderma sp. CBMAI-0711]|uniref:COX17, cytochrome C oxidase assembly protein n=1 Tax=Trichoderma parareesei TaxID=858221 RepID=A0A2H2YYA0_TRIPA|nr:hypothetical protein MKX07_005339 [Trichoderma sp. CBMAI-0711]OTA00943.1 COX17, cytochrome C oxidase assembly protein [Trichoderma parareesei]
MDAKPATFSLASAPVTSPTASTTTAAASKPKPCCVCKEEKSRRDECMLFSTAKDPAADCRSLVDQYKSCMQGFGFSV